MLRYAMAGAFVFALLAGDTPAQAREYPWCVRYDWSTYNCGFVSWEQCRMTASGQNRAWCYENPRYVPGPPPKRKVPR